MSTAHEPRHVAPPRRRARQLTTAIVSTVLLTGCGDVRDSATAPVSRQSTDINGLWTLSLWLGVSVWVIVMALLAVPVLRSRHRSGAPGDAGRGRPPAGTIDEPSMSAEMDRRADAQADVRVRSRLLWIGGVVGPVLILAVLLFNSGRVGASTAPTQGDGDLVVEVVGHMFWWEVHYPEHDVTTANEVHVPADRRISLRLRTDDVIHSFWIPRVHGKVDMIPGQENQLTFEVTETGSFRGNCAEFCGIAHAQMVAHLEVQEQAEFDQWLADQSTQAAEPDGGTTARGREVFLEAGCASCHTVMGTQASGSVGPDLTHIASRETLAAGIVPNTRANLSQLIIEPSDLKPGIEMPPTRLDDDELDALLDYLEALR